MQFDDLDWAIERLGGDGLDMAAQYWLQTLPQRLVDRLPPTEKSSEVASLMTELSRAIREGLGVVDPEDPGGPARDLNGKIQDVLGRLEQAVGAHALAETLRTMHPGNIYQQIGPGAWPLPSRRCIT